MRIPFFALFSCVLLAGFRGGGGSSSTPVTPTARLLVPQAGQSWTYNVSAVLTSGSTNANQSGTLTQTCAATSVAGASLQAVGTGTLTSGNQSVALDTAELVQTDSAGDIDVVALQNTISSTPEFLKAPILLAPAVFSSSFSYSSSTTTTDTNSPYSVTFTVIGEESVTVPAGTFSTWKVTSTTVQGTTTSVETQWWAPEIGNFVKDSLVETDSTTPNNSSTLSAQLTSTTVAH